MHMHICTHVKACVVDVYATYGHGLCICVGVLCAWSAILVVVVIVVIEVMVVVAVVVVLV